jgi:hypothetical protein
VKVKKAILSDKSNVDVKNSAGAFFSPPYEIDIPIFQIQATKNYSSFQFTSMAGYVGKINSDAYHGLAAKTLKIDDVQSQSAYEGGTSFIRVTWVLLYDPDKWNPTRVLDRGFYHLVAGKPVPFLDAGGHNYEGLLDGAGAKSAVPTYHNFTFYTETSFAGLP